MPVFRYLFFFSLEIGAGGDIEEDEADAEGHAAIENEGTDTGEVINQRGKEYDKEVAQSAGEQPEAGNDALEVLAGCGVGIFKACGAHQDFRKGEQEVGDTLPEDAEVVAATKAAGFDNLKGHKSVGGLRASIYNAMPKEGVEALVEFLKKYEAEHA